MTRHVDVRDDCWSDTPRPFALKFKKRTETKGQAFACTGATIAQITFSLKVLVLAPVAGELVIYALTAKSHFLTELSTVGIRCLPCSPQSYPQV